MKKLYTYSSKPPKGLQNDVTASPKDTHRRFFFFNRSLKSPWKKKAMELRSLDNLLICNNGNISVYIYI